MVRYLATSMVLFGCGEVLGIPDDPYVVPPDAAALEPAAAGSADAGAITDIDGDPIDEPSSAPP